MKVAVPREGWSGYSAKPPCDVSEWSMRNGAARLWALCKADAVVLLGILDPDPQAAKATTLTLHLRHRDAPDHGR
jgi:hypothetical protein